MRKCKVCGRPYIKKSRMQGTTWFLHSVEPMKTETIGIGCYRQIIRTKTVKLKGRK